MALTTPKRVKMGAFYRVLRLMELAAEFGYTTCPRGYDHRRHACLQRGMDHGREARIMIGRNLVHPACLLRLRVHGGISPADKPEYRWGVPRSSEAAKVLARRRRLGFVQPVRSKVLAERVNHARGC